MDLGYEQQMAQPTLAFAGICCANARTTTQLYRPCRSCWIS